jgi:hypothetical protein
MVKYIVIQKKKKKKLTMNQIVGRYIRMILLIGD